MSAESKVLIIEDDADIAKLLEIHLVDLHFDVDLAADGLIGLEKACRGSYLMVIIDVMLPQKNGLEICKQLRAIQPTVPILLITARSEECDKILGFEAGADDYITKPFSVAEVIARIKALLRRSNRSRPKKALESKNLRLLRGDLHIDTETRRVTQQGKEVILTVREFDLLVFLATHPGRAFSRQELLNHVWGYSYEGYEHTVSSHVNRLRTKVETDPSRPALLQTVWGYGYRFVSTNDLETATNDRRIA